MEGGDIVLNLTSGDSGKSTKVFSRSVALDSKNQKGKNWRQRHLAKKLERRKFNKLARSKGKSGQGSENDDRKPNNDNTGSLGSKQQESGNTQLESKRFDNKAEAKNATGSNVERRNNTRKGDRMQVEDYEGEEYGEKEGRGEVEGEDEAANKQKKAISHIKVASSLFSNTEKVDTTILEHTIKHANNMTDKRNAQQNSQNKTSNSTLEKKDFEALHGVIRDQLGEMMDITKPTKIQSIAIPKLIQKNRDSFIQAETGSGKTLSYLVPIVNWILNLSIDRSKSIKNDMERSVGTLAIVLVPTRELANQVHETARKLLNIPTKILSKHGGIKFHWAVSGVLIGGEKKSSEKARLRKGINILCCTPGRLLDHLTNTQSFGVDQLGWLVLDEADRLLEMGFHDTITSILSHLKAKQTKELTTVLCSATLKNNVKSLVDLALVNPITLSALDNPIDLNTNNDSLSNQQQQQQAIPSQLRNEYLIVPTKLRLVALAFLLYTCIRNQQKKQLAENNSSKILVFLSNRDSVDFLYNLFSSADFSSLLSSSAANEDLDLNSVISNNQNKSQDSEIYATCALFKNTNIYRLHGSLSQQIRTATTNAFVASDKDTNKILICSDVASRGLDIPYVTNIVHYDPPTSIDDYIHRVGRTARLGNFGTSCLFLLPNQLSYVNYLSTSLSSTNKNFAGFSPSYESYLDLLKLAAKYLSGYENQYVTLSAKLQSIFELLIIIDPKPSSNLPSSSSSATTTTTNTTTTSSSSSSSSPPSIATLAKNAYLSSVRAYNTHSSAQRSHFNFKSLHLGHFAKSFALRESPRSIANPSRPSKATSAGNSSNSTNSSKRSSSSSSSSKFNSYNSNPNTNSSSDFVIASDISEYSGPRMKKSRS
ncbi:ATP-dependent RNA helicase dbp7 [Zancudomyces culisetae]|uniref:ATP-dependent RNA helicase n=1 Tax=Zancudomyces culisetae TaxID=1213189 RepID=A0A1R1PLZ7_ZANCU|nr:ATP-dependent RNA helicase dbp7 [Zancudomyces culisetae]|eukprot:OMH81985.1 ATP-dependent RNA helicase dbp7 [Zancudomyces culisetae]